MGESFAYSALSNQQIEPEYIVYSFRRQEGRRGADAWQAMTVSGDITKAREKARSLYHSSRYSRVELRKKFMSKETGQIVDIPIEILGSSPDRAMTNILFFLALAMGCALAALGLSLFFI